MQKKLMQAGSLIAFFKKALTVFLIITITVPTSTLADTNISSEKLPVLLYHHILPESSKEAYFPENSAVISLELFEAQMEYLHRNNFHTITLTELQDFLFDNVPLPPKSVMLHFDDGYYSNFVYGLPILERYGFVAQLFLIGAAVYDRGDAQPDFSHQNLIFTAATTIEGTGHVFETANHTFAAHHIVEDTGLSAFVYYDINTVKQDLIRGFDFVSDHRAFAYPQGQYSPQTIELLESLDVTMAFTTVEDYVSEKSNNMLLPRFTVGDSISLDRFMDIVNGIA